MKTAAIPFIVAATLLLPCAARAELEVNKGGVALVPPAANTGAVVQSEQASTARDPKKNGGQTLRCWQNGRLLYESAGFRADVAGKPNAVAVPRIDGESVVIFDNKESVCILSKK